MSEVLQPDGLPLPEVGDWAEDKYRLTENYARMFSRSMRGKWRRAYVDLFAGAGWARIRGTRRIVRGTAFRALAVPDPFDQYVLCEIDPDRLAACRARATRDFPDADIRYVEGDCNNVVNAIVDSLPDRGGGDVLSFCVVDPFRIADLKFATVRRLAYLDRQDPRRIDFLVLIPSYMDAHRNRDHYLEADNPTLDEFLGTAGWRDASAGEEARLVPGPDFGLFVLNAFGRSMQDLGYRWDGAEGGGAKLMRGTKRRQKLYHLAFFSRHELGAKFAREAQRYASEQLGFRW